MLENFFLNYSGQPFKDARINAKNCVIGKKENKKSRPPKETASVNKSRRG